MKKAKNFFQVIATLLMMCIIILIGYRSLAIAGNYFIMSDNEIKTYPAGNDSSYVFYSQSASEITLFPWGYEKDAVPITGIQTEAEQHDMISTDALYTKLRYYFYKTIPSNVKENIIASDQSLYNIMSFSELENKLTVSTTSDEIYYFYNDTIELSGVRYSLSFSFNEALDICSFQCREIVDETVYTSDNMRLGNEWLSSFINNNDPFYLSLLILDVYMSSDSLENYRLNYINSNEIRLNMNSSFSSSEEIKLEYFYTEYDSEIKNTSNTSYQIIETENELLLVLANSRIVLRFDPISRTFTGFNFMERY